MGSVALHAEQPRANQIMEMVLPFPSDFETSVVGRVALTVGNVIFVPFFLAFNRDIGSDGSCAAVAAYCIDMENFHAISSITKRGDL